MPEFEAYHHTVYCFLNTIFRTEEKYSGETVTFDLLAGRPGNAKDGSLSARLHGFLQASAVRVILSGYHELVTDPRLQYHAIKELRVLGRCSCHGRASRCDVTEGSYTCKCDAGTHSAGARCETCTKSAFLTPGGDLYSANMCGQCACERNGTTGGDTSCKQVLQNVLYLGY